MATSRQGRIERRLAGIPAAGMRRRDFIVLLASFVVPSPLPLRAQPGIPVIGLLCGRSADDSAYLVAAFRQGLKESGYVEGKNVAIEFGWAQYQYDQLPALATDLVRRSVAVIVAIADPPALAAKAVTTTIPIIFLTGEDPVQLGLVASLNRPGGNLTGVSVLSGALTAKQFQLLRELVPKADLVAHLVNPSNPRTEEDMRELQAAARAIGVQILVVNASTESGFDEAFGILVEHRASALLVQADPFFNSRPYQIAAHAAHQAVPAIYSRREFAAAGGLMSYGSSLVDAWRVTGVYAGRILKGDKPSDLPVQQSTRVELVINLKTAKTLGLTIPLPLLGRADEVIE